MTAHRKSVTEIVLLISCLSGLLSAAFLPAQAGIFAGLHALYAAEGEADAGGEKPKKKGYSDEAIKHYNRGHDFHQNGSLNQAIQAYKDAIAADGRIAEAYSNLGAIYLRQKNYPKAVEAFNKALALKPDKPTTLNGLGNALYARGQAAEAKDKWAKAIEIDPRFASAYYNLGNAMESEKDDKAALFEYMKAIDCDAKLADAYYRIGGILHKSKHTAQANVFLKKSVELSPNADFLKDAQKMLKEQETEFSREIGTKEVEMTVMPPTRETGTGVKKTTSGDGTVAAVEKKSPSEKTPAKVAPDGAAPKERPRFPLFRRKAKEEKKVEMFVQPPDAHQDLKPSPGANQAPDGATDTGTDTWK